MERLRQNDFNKIKEVFKLYSSLNLKDKDRVDKLFSAKLSEVYPVIAARCEQDWAWNLLYEHFHNPEKIKTFSINKYNYGINRSTELYPWADFKALDKEYHQKLHQIDQQRFPLGKGIKFHRLQKKLDDFENIVAEEIVLSKIESAKDCLNNQDIKYKKLKKAERQIKATRIMQEGFDNATNKITYDVIHEFVKQNPYFAVAELHTPDLVVKQKTPKGKTVWIDTAYLKRVLSNIKCQSLGIDQTIDSIFVK